MCNYVAYNCLLYTSSFYSASALRMLAMQTALIATAILSVYLSVTNWCSVQMNKDTIMLS